MAPGISSDTSAENRAEKTRLERELFTRTDMSSTHYRHDACVKLVFNIVYKGASLDKNDKNGYTPLINCARYGHHDMAGLLLEKGANPAKGDTSGWTPLHWAVQNGNVKIVESLILHGADIHAPSKEGWTPMELARRKPHDHHSGTLHALEKAELKLQKKNIDSLAHSGLPETRQTPPLPPLPKKKWPGPR